MTSAGPFGTPKMTTAQMLGQYRRELESEGIDSGLARDLVRQMAMRLSLDDLRVGEVCKCLKCRGGS